MQEVVLASREEMYQQNEAEVRNRWSYEDAVSVCKSLQSLYWLKFFFM